MATKSELRKYRKEAIKEVTYQNVYVDGIIETKQGYFTKMYRCLDDVLKIFDMIHVLYNTQEETNLDSVNAQLTRFKNKFYLTLGLQKSSYEEAVEAFKEIDNVHILRALSLIERLNILHIMYQNDDSFVERFEKYSYRKPKKGEIEPTLPHLFDEDYPVADQMKKFYKNRKTSKDLIIPLYMLGNATEMEFEGNYIRLFYLKNTPRYITQKFLDDLVALEDVFFSLHFTPLNQQDIIQYTEDKFVDAKDLKEAELAQKQFFENARIELARSAKRNEEMFLITLVLGMYNDSIDELNAKMKKLVRDMECSYVVKELRFQQKDAFNTFLPYCEDKLDVQTTIYKAKEQQEV